MAKNDKFERWGDKREKWERKSDRLRISRNSEGAWNEDAAVYIRNRDFIGFTLNVSEAREVAAAIIAAADEFELILAEPDVIEPSIREQVEALPVGSTFRVTFGDDDSSLHENDYSAEYLRTAKGLVIYSRSFDATEEPAVLKIYDPYWAVATNLEILHLAG